MDIIFVVVILDGENNIKHQCYYSGVPSISSIKDLFRELVDDDEFGMKDSDYVDTLKVIIMDVNDLNEKNKAALNIEELKKEFRSFIH